MLIHEVPYEPPTVINENQFEILKQDNDVDDTYLKQKATEDLVKPSWVCIQLQVSFFSLKRNRFNFISLSTLSLDLRTFTSSEKEELYKET